MTLRAVKPQHETRTRILDAAEELFMQHGFEGTSMRLLTAKAGVNLAAVNYHFGSKHALVEAVFRRRLDPMNAARLAELDKLEAAERAPSPESVTHDPIPNLSAKARSTAARHPLGFGRPPGILRATPNCAVIANISRRR